MITLQVKALEKAKWTFFFFKVKKELAYWKWHLWMAFFVNRLSLEYSCWRNSQCEAAVTIVCGLARVKGTLVLEKNCQCRQDSIHFHFIVLLDLATGVRDYLRTTSTHTDQWWCLRRNRPNHHSWNNGQWNSAVTWLFKTIWIYKMSFKVHCKVRYQVVVQSFWWFFFLCRYMLYCSVEGKPTNYKTCLYRAY